MASRLVAPKAHAPAKQQPSLISRVGSLAHQFPVMKVDKVYQHVYDSYYGEGRSVYATAAA